MPIIHDTSITSVEEYMRCPTCSSDTFVEISMILGDKNVSFHRCGRCEIQHWESENDVIDLNRVLDYAKNLTF